MHVFDYDARTGMALASPLSDMTLEALRLVTIHPILVHITIGMMPFIVIAYAVAALRRSPSWTFAADVATALVAVATLGTFAFGLVSNGALAWPGGTGPWRGLHLAFGAASTTLLFALAVARVVLRRREPIASWSIFGFASAAAIVIGFTGWIGGEILVYRVGMAVEGAAKGALGPPLNAEGTPPKTVPEAMDQIRPLFGLVETRIDGMVVHAPNERDFDLVGQAARRLAALADRLPDLAVTAPGQRQGGPSASQAGAPAQAHGGGPPPTLGSMATSLAAHARELEQAAAARDLSGAIRAAGALKTACAECHTRARWTE